MRIEKIKHVIASALPTPLTALLKTAWQAGRRIVNNTYFALCEPGVVVFNLRRSEVGQLNQPLIVDCLLKGRRDGFFLDIGANHPERNSNTHYFEKHRAYRGIAFDPLDKYRSEWETARPNTLFVNVAAGAAFGTIGFYQHANTDGWADQLSCTDLSAGANKAGLTRRLVEMVPLAEYGQLPQSVSFASIDVEGAESEVLKGFGQTLRPDVLVVENCFGPVGNKNLRKQVREMGYQLVARVSYIDDVFVRNELTDEAGDLRELLRSRPELFR